MVCHPGRSYIDKCISSLKQVFAYVSAEVLAFKLYLASLSERLDESLVLRLSIRAHSNDTSASRDNLSVLESCASMEDYAALHIVNARYLESLLVFLRIAAADHHDTYGRTRVELYRLSVEVPLSYTLEQVHTVALAAQHHSLRLRVAHAEIVLDDH